MKRTVFLCLAIVMSVCASAQTWEDTLTRIEKIFARYKSTSPGIQLAISRNGQLLLSKAWGMADLEHNAALTTRSVSEAGSVSKQFTAAAILLLEQEGKLSLDDDVRKHIPELPGYGQVVTLRHMMQHTSGLKDWGSIAYLAGWPRSTKTYNNNDALYIMTRQKTLNHKPGDEFVYSNSNYNLFAIIVERVSGMSLAEFTKKKIFIPAGMNLTEWRSDFKKIVPNRAIAYRKMGAAYEADMPNEYVYGNGGLLTTAEDLVTWNSYYTSGKLGNPSLLQKQIATKALNTGVVNEYAAGIVATKYKGWTVYSHDGATSGYRANLDYFPELGLSMTWLSNTSEFSGASPNLTLALRDLFLTEKTSSASPAALPAFTVTPEKLNQYTGWYINSRSGGGTRMYIQNGKLYNNNLGELKPVAENVFASGANKIHMNNGTPRASDKGFVIVTSADDKIFFKGAANADTTQNALNEYTGEYYSDEAQVKMIVKMVSGKLILQLEQKQDNIPFTPTFRDGFDIPQGNVLFVRDKKNKITGFNVSISRARNIQFSKL